MLRNLITATIILISAVGCEVPVDSFYIKNEENREYFMSLLNEQNIPFDLAVVDGEETMTFDRSDSDRVKALIDQYVAKELQPGRTVCYKKQKLLDKEVEKLEAANAPFKLARNYAYTCIVWNEEDSEEVESVIY